MTELAVKASDVCSCIGKENLLKEINFEIPKQSLTSIIGPSGSGKSTLLNTIAGFQPICQGEITISDQSVSRPGYTLSPDKRSIGMVFQDHALFPHLSVLENIKTGSEKKTAKQDYLDFLIDKLQLKQLLNRRPHELSGGQQQRTALARALVSDPQVLLLDEPFANLNQELQVEIGATLIDLVKSTQTSILLVTHDESDAMAISDQIIVLMHGTIVQSGSPQNIYARPANKHVAQFICRGSFIKANYLGEGKVETGLGVVDINNCKDQAIQPGQSLDLWLHPENILMGEGTAVKFIKHSWRALDLLIKVQTSDGQQLLIKSDQTANIDNFSELKVKLDEKIRYSAF